MNFCRAYAYSQNGSIKCQVGSKKTVSALFNEHLNANRKEKDPSDRKVVLMFLVPIALIVAAFLFAYIRKHPMEKTLPDA